MNTFVPSNSIFKNLNITCLITLLNSFCTKRREKKAMFVMIFTFKKKKISLHNYVLENLIYYVEIKL